MNLDLNASVYTRYAQLCQCAWVWRHTYRLGISSPATLTCLGGSVCGQRRVCHAVYQSAAAKTLLSFVSLALLS